MARSISSDFRTSLESGGIRPRLFLEIEVDGSTLRYWTGSYDVSWNAQTWLGNGLIKHIGGISYSNDTEANGLSIEFAGEPSAMISLGLQSFRQGKSCTLYLGLMSDAGSLLSSPITLWKGVVDSAEIVDAAETATVVVSCENKLVAMGRPKEFRYNDETQKIFYSSDTGFRYMPAMEEWTGYFGKPQSSNRKNRRKKRNRKKGRRK